MDCASFGTISAATGASDHSVRRRRSTNTELHRCRQHRRSRLPACSCRSAVHAHSPLPLQLPCDLHVAARILVLRRLIAHLHRYWLYCRCCHWDCCHGCQCLSLHARHRRHPGWLRSRATIVEQARLGTKGIHSNEWFVWLLLYSLRNRLVNDSSSSEPVEWLCCSVVHFLSRSSTPRSECNRARTFFFFLNESRLSKLFGPHTTVVFTDCNRQTCS